MNQFWPAAITALLSGDLDLLDAPLAIKPWQDLYFNATDTTLTDLYGTPIGVSAVELQGRRVAGRELQADPLTFPAIPESNRIGVLVLHRTDTLGLIGYIDQRPDLAPISVQGNGGPVTFTWGGTTGSTVISL